MIIRSSKIRIVLAFMALFLIQFAILSPVSADLTEVETHKQGLSKTEPTDASGGEPVDGKDGPLPWWKKALNELGDIGDSLVDGWNKFKDWAVDEWNDAWDFAEDKWNDAWDIATDVWGKIEDFFKSIGEWFSENEWAQTLLGGILAAGIIIGVIALLVFFGVIAIPLGIVAGLIIVAGALIGGFTYQWLAGDNYSFWGAFSFALVGGVLGYIGYATGAFAAAIGWLRTVAWPAAANWWRTAAWPWLRGRPAAIWGWARTVAWPWIRTKAVAAYRWVKVRPLWGQLRGFYSGAFWRLMVKGFPIGFLGGGTASIVGKLFKGETFTFKEMLIDALIGGFSGAVLGPIILAGVTLSWSVVGLLGLYGGVENYLVEGFKSNDWSFENFLLGFGISVLSTKLIGVAVENIISRMVVSEHLNEVGTKSAEELVKWSYDQIDELIDADNTGESNGKNSEKHFEKEGSNEKNAPEAEDTTDKKDASNTEKNNEGSNEQTDSGSHLQNQNNRMNPNINPTYN